MKRVLILVAMVSLLVVAQGIMESLNAQTTTMPTPTVTDLQLEIASLQTLTQTLQVQLQTEKALNVKLQGQLTALQTQLAALQPPSGGTTTKPVAIVNQGPWAALHDDISRNLAIYNIDQGLRHGRVFIGMDKGQCKIVIYPKSNGPVLLTQPNPYDLDGDYLCCLPFHVDVYDMVTGKLVPQAAGNTILKFYNRSMLDGVATGLTGLGPPGQPPK